MLKYQQDKILGGLLQMVIEAERDNTRPYTPPSNVISVLQRTRSRNLPEIIDAEYLRDTGIPEGTITRTLFALRFLGLIGISGSISDQLKAIHTSTDEEYKTILGGLIRESYREVFNVIDPAQDPQDKILNFFRRYTPASQRSRMVIFFLGMCREAGISTLDVPKARSMGNKPTRQSAAPTVIRIGRPKHKGKGEVINKPTIAPALDGLFKSLPAPGTPLSKAKREQWIVMAEAILKFLYPDEPQEPAEITQDGGSKQETTTMAGQ
jgi:hypothetical protein